MIRFARNHVLPQDSFGEMLYFLLTVLIVGTYISRYLFFLTGNYGPLGLVGLACLPLVCLPIMGVVIYLCASIAYSWKSKNPFPLIAFFPLFALVAYFLPLGPMPPSKAEQHFRENRADYENMVDLARRNQLSSTNLQWEAEVVKQNPLVVTFNPYGYNRVIVYADKKSDLKNASACDKDGSIYRQLDSHWWLCYREWN